MCDWLLARGVLKTTIGDFRLDLNLKSLVLVLALRLSHCPEWKKTKFGTQNWKCCASQPLQLRICGWENV